MKSNKEFAFRALCFLAGIFTGIVLFGFISIATHTTYGDGIIEARRECHEVKQLTLTVDPNCHIVERMRQ